MCDWKVWRKSVTDGQTGAGQKNPLVSAMPEAGDIKSILTYELYTSKLTFGKLYYLQSIVRLQRLAFYEYRRSVLFVIWIN